MRLPRFFEKKRGERRTGSQVWASAGEAAFYAALLVAGLVFGGLLVFGVAVPEWRLNHDFLPARGVVLADGTVVDADIVVSDADAAHLYRDLVPRAEQALASRVKLSQAHYSMGLFVMYFGTTRTYPDVAHHTIWMGERYRELLEDIFHRQKLAEDF